MKENNITEPNLKKCKEREWEEEKMREIEKKERKRNKKKERKPGFLQSEKAEERKR